eukprot:5659170-Amphidinium_carterae.1
MMAPPEPRPMTHEVGSHMPHAPHDPRVPSRPIGIQGTLDPFDFQNQGGGQGGGNHVHLASNKGTHLHGPSQPREASSIDLPKLPTPPKFKSWRSADCTVEGMKPSDPQLAQIIHGFTTLDAKLNAAVWKISHGEILRRLFISSERLAAKGTLLTGRRALAVVFDYYGEDQRTTFLHGCEVLRDLKCRSDAELPHFWTTWQFLMLSMGEKVPEHLLLELLWTRVKESGCISNGLGTC